MHLHKVIISLTSYPLRIRKLSVVIESLLMQELQATKVVLWLSLEEFPNKKSDLPQDLLSLLSDKFEINWCENIRSYKKLIPSLDKFPNAVLVTADDDVIYPKEWLKGLYKSYVKYPEHIHAYRIRRILLNRNEELQPYNQWPVIKRNTSLSSLNFFTGAGGVLYPPNVFCDDWKRKDLYQYICPYGDDIWFWAMAILKNAKIKAVKLEGDIKFIDGTQENSLWKINQKGENDEALERLFEKFPSIRKTVLKEERHFYNRFFLLKIKAYNLIKKIKNHFIKLMRTLAQRV